MERKYFTTSFTPTSGDGVEMFKPRRARAAADAAAAGAAGTVIIHEQTILGRSSSRTHVQLSKNYI